MSLEFNGAVETMHAQLHDEISHINQKIKDACGSENVTFEDLVQFKYGVESGLMKPS